MDGYLPVTVTRMMGDFQPTAAIDNNIEAELDDGQNTNAGNNAEVGG